jgi:hypothetical protein
MDSGAVRTWKCDEELIKGEFLAALAESFPNIAAADLNAIGDHVLELMNGEIVVDFVFGSLSESFLFTHNVTDN